MNSDPTSPPRAASLRRREGRCTLAILACVLGFGAAQRAAADWTDDYIRGLMRSNNIPAVAVAVITNGVVAKAQGYGPGVTRTTVFQLDSVTKQFTATLVMQLAGQGRLATNQFVSSILANAPTTWQGITIAHLLSHTAGVTDTLNRGLMGGPWQQNENPFPFLTHIFNAPLVSSNPGSCYLYSDFGYYTLGAVVEKVTGQPYSDLLQTQVFGPAGMTQSVVLNPEGKPGSHYGTRLRSKFRSFWQAERNRGWRGR